MHGMDSNSYGLTSRCAVFAITASVAAFAFFAPLQAAAAYDVHFEKTLRLTPGGDGRLHPVSVTCDPVSGEICVSEDANSTLHVLNSHGVETFRTGKFAGLSVPADGHVDAEGRLVALTLRRGSRPTIRRLDIYGEPDGYVPAEPVADWNPGHLLLLRDGHYLTLDTSSGLLVKHDARTGAVIWRRTVGGLEGESSQDKNLGRPVESPDGRICIPGGDLHVMLVLTADGDFIESFGRFGSAPGRMVFPVAAAYGPSGELLVLDRMRHKILVFGQDHGFVTEFGSLGSTPGTFYHPLSLASDGQGRIYVAQGYQGLVQVFSVPAAGTVE
jgi:DNA-binding beta-propeller fold protein YncE